MAEAELPDDARRLDDETLRAMLARAYVAFNTRDIETVLSLLHEDVAWPNGMEGGYVHGHEAVRDYWLRQWQTIDPRVDPVDYVREPDGRVRVEVHQVVRSLGGERLVDHMIWHIFRVEAGRIRDMEIRAAP